MSNTNQSQFHDVIDSATHVVDSELYVLEAEINWLKAVSPTKNDERWHLFKESGFSQVQPLTYPEITIDIPRLRRRLDALPFDDIENSLVSALLHEKKEELSLFLDLLSEREEEGFLSTSISLFGGSQPRLLEKAKEILEKVPGNKTPEEIVSVENLVESAKRKRDYYRSKRNDFHFEINVVDDLNSMMMVDHGDLYLAKSVRVPKSRVRPLIAHEVEVHVVTRYNGSCQPLRQMESGLAYYDALQEGLAALSEYLTGNLPGKRLRMLAARVVAVDLALRGEDIKTIFSELYEEYEMDAEDAFDTAVRAKRGGGLTKDAVYLEGLWDLLAYLKAGGNVESLFIGKYALEQREMIKKLLEQGVLFPPKILPEFIKGEKGKAILEKVRNMDLSELYH